MLNTTLKFYHRQAIVELDNVPAHRTLQELLRNDLQVHDTKEGCAEGDCGACTVVLGEPQGDKLVFKAVNSCIRLAHSVNGMAVFSAADLGADQPHPVQTALKECHASQCGFCTPGFTMSLFGLYQNKICQGQTVTPRMAHDHLSGNLCRCTGYRPIIEAACTMGKLPTVHLDHVAITAQLRQASATPTVQTSGAGYLRPKHLQGVLQARIQYPQAQLVAGCTDVGLWVTKHHREWPHIIDVTQAQELLRLEFSDTHLTIGAAVSLENAWAAITQDRPQLHAYWHRFAGLPVRNSGTMGGNIANGSPIGDAMPVLIALNAHIALASLNKQGDVTERILPLESLYTGYKQNCMATGEVLSWIRVARPTATEWMQAYKISKRQEDDISAVALAIRVDMNTSNKVSAVSIGAGGVGPVPARATHAEQAMLGQAWQLETIQAAQRALAQQFSPISDMRASAEYRAQVLGNLMHRAWLQSHPPSTNMHGVLSLEDLV